MAAPQNGQAEPSGRVAGTASTFVDGITCPAAEEPAPAAAPAGVGFRAAALLVSGFPQSMQNCAPSSLARPQ